jgi:hypothetical protein
MAAIFPSAVATQLQLLTAQNNAMIVLDADCDFDDDILTVSDPSSLPSSGYLTFIDTDEVLHYTGKTTSTLTGVTRGADGTSAAGHLAGVDLEQRWNADYHNIVTLELVAVEQYLSDRFGIGTSPVVPAGKTLAVGGAADSKALLTLTSTTLGFLPPRMTTTQRDAISSPTAGLMIYNSTTSRVNFTDGVAWRPMLTANVSEIVDADISSAAAITRSKLVALTASRAMVTNASGVDSASSVTATELGYLSGVTSAIQTQIGTLLPLTGGTMTGAITFNFSSATSEPLIFTNSSNTQKGFIALNTAAASCELDIATNRDAVTGTYNKTGQGSAYIGLSSSASAGSITLGATATNNGSPTTVATFTDAVNTFSVPLRLPSGSSGTNAVGIGAANTGFYSAGSGQVQMMSLGTQVFGTDGTANYSSVDLVTANLKNLGSALYPWAEIFFRTTLTNATAYTFESVAAGGLTRIVQQTSSVSTTATVIMASFNTGLMIVQGNNGSGLIFCDLIHVGLYTGTVNVLSSLSVLGSPAARTYSNPSSAIKVAMGSGTYSVLAEFIGCYN